MNMMLFKAHYGFHHHLKDAQQKKANTKVAILRHSIAYKHSSKWSKLRPTICSFVNNYIYLLEQHSDETVVECGLKCLSKLIPFIVPLQALVKKVLRCLLQTWSSSKNENVVILAFLRIRQLAVDSHQSFAEYIMKSAYLSYVRNSKFSNSETVKRVSIMKQCVVELYTLDLKSAYQCAFIYIRQLGVHVRNALKDKSKQALKQVCNFQFLSSVRLWASMIANSKSNELQPLCFPLVQIIVSCIRLSYSSCFFPFRLHCIELLVFLESSTNDIIIPVLPLILDMLKNSNIDSHEKRSVNMKIPEFEVFMKASLIQIRSNSFKDMVIMKSLKLMESHLSMYKDFLAFSEISHVAFSSLKKMQRKLKTPRWRQLVKALIFRIEKWMYRANALVKSMHYSPSDIEKPITFGVCMPKVQLHSEPNVKEDNQSSLFEKRYLVEAEHQEHSRQQAATKYAENSMDDNEALFGAALNVRTTDDIVLDIR